MKNYKVAALTALAGLALMTGGCGGGATVSTENGGYNRSAVITYTDKNGKPVKFDCSVNGYDQNKSAELVRAELEHVQRMRDAENAHKETMHRETAEQIYKGQKLDAKTQTTATQNDKEKSSKSSTAEMQRELFDEVNKL